jgi:hypothetical protein
MKYFVLLVVVLTIMAREVNATATMSKSTSEKLPSDEMGVLNPSVKLSEDDVRCATNFYLCTIVRPGRLLACQDCAARCGASTLNSVQRACINPLMAPVNICAAAAGTTMAAICTGKLAGGQRKLLGSGPAANYGYSLKFVNGQTQYGNFPRGGGQCCGFFIQF